MSRALNPVQKSAERFEDPFGGCGPDEGGVLVPVIHPGVDLGLEGLDGAAVTAAEQIHEDEGEEPLDRVQPGRAGWGVRFSGMPGIIGNTDWDRSGPGPGASRPRSASPRTSIRVQVGPDDVTGFFDEQRVGGELEALLGQRGLELERLPDPPDRRYRQAGPLGGDAGSCRSAAARTPNQHAPQMGTPTSQSPLPVRAGRTSRPFATRHQPRRRYDPSLRSLAHVSSTPAPSGRTDDMS